MALAIGMASDKILHDYSQTLDIFDDYCSKAKSVYETPSFTLSSQTMMFFDWDETLFPTWTILKAWEFDDQVRSDKMPTLSADQVLALAPWGQALLEFMREACRLSDGVYIITNSKRGWIEKSIRLFAPSLSEFFALANVKVIYALDDFLQTKRCSSKPVSKSHKKTRDETEDEMTRAKFRAMRNAVTEFYTQYKDQTWKNIISFGDATYEHDALHDVAFQREPPPFKDETIRLKTVHWKGRASVENLTGRLRLFCGGLLPLVRHSKALDLNLVNKHDLTACLADSLGMKFFTSVLYRHQESKHMSASNEKDEEAWERQLEHRNQMHGKDSSRERSLSPTASFPSTICSSAEFQSVDSVCQQRISL